MLLPSHALPRCAWQRCVAQAWTCLRSCFPCRHALGPPSPWRGVAWQAGGAHLRVCWMRPLRRAQQKQQARQRALRQGTQRRACIVWCVGEGAYIYMRVRV